MHENGPQISQFAQYLAFAICYGSGFDSRRLCGRYSGDDVRAAVIHVNASFKDILFHHEYSYVFDSADMKLATLSNANDLIGAVSGCFFAGGMIGAFAASEVTDYLGRRVSIFISCVFAVIGGALQAGSINMAMFIAARLVAGLGIGEFYTEVIIAKSKKITTSPGGLFAAIPIYASEISPPSIRGLSVGFHGVFIAFGTVLCKCVASD